MGKRDSTKKSVYRFRASEKKKLCPSGRGAVKKKFSQRRGGGRKKGGGFGESFLGA